MCMKINCLVNYLYKKIFEKVVSFKSLYPPLKKYQLRNHAVHKVSLTYLLEYEAP